MSFTPDQIEQSKQISDMMAAVGKALEGSANAKLQVLGKAISAAGSNGGVLSDMATIEAEYPNFKEMIDAAGKVAAGMIGTAAGIAALEGLLTASTVVAFSIGGMLSVAPIVGTLAIGSAYFLAGYAGGQFFEGAYSWAKESTELLSSNVGSNAIELPPTYVVGYYPDDLPVTDPSWLNAHLENFSFEIGTPGYYAEMDRMANKDFLHEMSSYVSDYNTTLADLITPGDFLHRDQNGMYGWDGGIGALQEYGIQGGGLNIFDTAYGSWSNQFNTKMVEFIDSSRRMQDFINSDFGRANNALGGEAQSMSNKASETENMAEEALAELTPLAFDLTGNGITTRSIFEGIRGFEFEQGIKGAYHGWLGQDSGFLALDRNGNGKIDDGTELFGGPTEDGFTALRRFDSNSDGRIDSGDEIFDKLLIWQDKNQNTESEADELLTLREAGIQSISLDKVENVYRPDEQGNAVRWISEYTLSSGETREIVDVYFAYSPAASIQNHTNTTTVESAVIDQQTQLLIENMAGCSHSFAGEFEVSAQQKNPLEVTLAVS
ncbi:hypothetical protein [uncultured Pseudomonas sp.]|uniref:hypothetical protein n=1 Tax=uncultured Pseudomonas sp. TaxID=114707 RepID=UPI0025D671ED|nr:hypothetical protein [uncultured Pseudomonas sp.]